MPAAPLDHERCYRAVHSRDARFDGWFVTAVHTTGIYCRPSCPAVTPKRAHVSFFRTPAAAQQAGFRACRRCRPDATPGSPEWDLRADAAGRAMRLIADGVVDREGVGGLARRLGYSERHLHRLLVNEVGAGPLALARAQRAQAARVLIETTDLGFADIAFAAGFSSVRQFNDTVREVFAATPTRLRGRPGHAGRRPDGASVAPTTLALRLAVRRPFAGPDAVRFLALRALPGVEASGAADGAPRFARSLRLAHGAAVVELVPAADHVRARLRLDDARDLTSAVRRCRRLLDLDADPEAVDAHLGADPLLGPLVAARPGRRSPGAVDGDELAVRAVLGQQVSVGGARTEAGRLAGSLGTELAHPHGEVTRLFPAAATLAEAGPDAFRGPARRRAALHGLCAALAAGRVRLDPGADRSQVEQQLLALPGIGPWTASYIALRALGDPDVFLPTDLGVRRGVEAIARPAAASADLRPAALARRAETWRPWRSYAVHHLWAAAAAHPAPPDPDPDPDAVPAPPRPEEST